MLPRLACLTLCRSIHLLVQLARGDAAKELEILVLRPLGSENRTSCRDLVVLVNLAIEAIPAPNKGGSRNRIGPSPDLDTRRRPKREASVRPLLVVVPHVLIEHTFKVASTPDQHPVQALLPHGSSPPLSEGVGVRCLDRRLDGLDAIGGKDVVEGTRELAVAVANEELRCAGSRCRLCFPAHRETLLHAGRHCCIERSPRATASTRRSNTTDHRHGRVVRPFLGALP